MKPSFEGYYFVTDAALSRAGNARDVAAAAAAGVRVVQYREKKASTLKMFEEACALRALCRGLLFLVNDRLDVALAAGADGVHLGQDDLPYDAARRLLGPGRVIGLTVHSVAEALQAERAGADYVGVSPVFATATKKDAGAPAGTALVAAVRRAVSLPVVAIGGITLENAAQVISAGAHGVCAISCVVGSADPAAEIRKFQALFRR